MAERTQMKQLESWLDAMELGIRQNQKQIKERLETMELGLCQTQKEVSRSRAKTMVVEGNLRKDFSHLQEEFSGFEQQLSTVLTLFSRLPNASLPADFLPRANPAPILAEGRTRRRITTQPKPRGHNTKRVQVFNLSSSSTLKRTHNGSAFASSEKCNKQMLILLLGWPDYQIEAHMRRALDAQMAEQSHSVYSIREKRAKAKMLSQTQRKPRRKRNKGKDLNAPEHPPTAFFLVMDEFSKSFKEANPGCKIVSMVAKGVRCGTVEVHYKWGQKPYVDRVAELKEEYNNALKSKNNGRNVADNGERLKQDIGEYMQKKKNNKNERNMEKTQCIKQTRSQSGSTSTSTSKRQVTQVIEEEEESETETKDDEDLEEGEELGQEEEDEGVIEGDDEDIDHDVDD
ncbi:high mobility group B protein 7-like [Diospyros lotus]|uniref:high mobility group B protein 7-like n=1 Tax=Diospyros lotus TaxID=55363 RepID=UPI002257DB40|nr:high mobility group B protein 7-like [Diospyros lotus]